MKENCEYGDLLLFIMFEWNIKFSFFHFIVMKNGEQHFIPAICDISIIVISKKFHQIYYFSSDLLKIRPPVLQSAILSSRDELKYQTE